MKKLIVSSVIAVALAAAPAVGRDRSQGSDTGHNASSDHGAAKGEGIFTLLPPDAVTDHVLKTEQGPLQYTATAGTLDLHGQDGALVAKVFYTAYRAKERAANRPVTFVFNGGPGAASAYLHLGLLGPKIVHFAGDNQNGTEPALQDNPQSWLALTDLVLVDPVGTGWSRAVSEDESRNFWSVRQDAASLAKVIALYVQNNNLAAAPKYLLGESYGGFRAAKVARALKDEQGILVSGITMISPLLDGRYLAGGGEDPLAAALQFPSLVAATMERHNGFDAAALADAERFAMTDYLVALAGPPLTGKQGDDFFAKIAQMTGLSEEVVRRTRGFAGMAYGKEALPAGQVLSPYDSSVSQADPYPEYSYLRNDDAILDGYTRAYGGAFASYARDDLNFKTEMTYSLLNEEVNRHWKWDDSRGGESRVTATVGDDLRDLLSTIPSMKLMIAQGYSDTLCPYSVARYMIDRLPPALSKDRVHLNLYHGGHMFYTHDEARKAITGDMASFYH